MGISIIHFSLSEICRKPLRPMGEKAWLGFNFEMRHILLIITLFTAVPFRNHAVQIGPDRYT